MGSVTFLTATSNVNNSVIFHRRKVPRVANERYCYIFFIFGVHWGKGVKGGPLGGTKKNRKTTKIAEKRKTSLVDNGEQCAGNTASMRALLVGKLYILRKVI